MGYMYFDGIDFYGTYFYNDKKLKKFDWTDLGTKRELQVCSMQNLKVN